MAFEQYLSRVPDGFGFDDHWNEAKGALAFLLGLAGPGNSRGSCSPPWYVRGPVVLAKKVLIEPRGFPRHIIRPLKVWFVLDFLQHPMYWFSEHSTDSLCVGCSELPYEISSRAVAVILVRLEIPPLLRDNLLFSLSLQLVFLYPLILVNLIH